MRTAYRLLVSLDRPSELSWELGGGGGVGRLPDGGRRRLAGNDDTTCQREDANCHRWIPEGIWAESWVSIKMRMIMRMIMRIRMIMSIRMWIRIIIITPIASRDFADSLLCAPFIMWHSRFYFKQANVQLSCLMGTFFRVNLKLRKKIKGFS